MTSFRVWAPQASAVALVLADRELPMVAADQGWWALDPPGLDDGADYGFRLDGADDVRPDPRSPWQPHGVHGRSRTVDHAAYAWNDNLWHGRPLAGSVLYELHVGTFTPAGTFDGVAARLPYLVDLGVDAIELLPVAATAGHRTWGYDGVGLFAVSEDYGGPTGLKNLVAAAHRAGIAVVLDVVYNHLGPSGNYLPEFGPYLGDAASPWGQAVNLDGPGSDEVRRFVLDNARQWFVDYHVDGLRLDAVHALHDGRATHLLEELAAETRALERELGRPLWLIAESDRNDPTLVRSRDAHGYGLDAQWDDDVHHAIHATLTGERQGYYADFGALPTLAKALERAFVHDGTWSSFRGRHHGRPAGDLPGERFVVFLQDHDQVGNRARGDRISASLPPGLLRVGAALTLLSPFTPMLFMGEEWAASTPWQFFADPDSTELAAATRDGRRREFADHGWEPGDVPDPCDPATFDASRLDWSETDAPEHAAVLAWYRTLIAVRRRVHGGREATSVTWDDGWLVLRRADVAVVCNLRPERRVVPVDGTPVEVLAASAEGFVYAPGSVELDGESVLVVRLS
ncbi:MAG TPA: malto-oligosyltrehalose trehalohydrolase [Mycobacteriales bacterium]